MVTAWRAPDACTGCVFRMRVPDACARCVSQMRVPDACAGCVRMSAHNQVNLAMFKHMFKHISSCITLFTIILYHTIRILCTEDVHYCATKEKEKEMTKNCDSCITTTRLVSPGASSLAVLRTPAYAASPDMHTRSPVISPVRKRVHL
jgi:hypothetical protein